MSNQSSETQIFYVSKTTYIILGLGSVFFIFLGTLFYGNNDIKSGSILFFIIGVLGIFSSIIILLNIKSNYLELTKEGFSVHRKRKTENFRWSEIEEFGISMGIVVFKIKYPDKGILQVSELITGGYHNMLFDNYGLNVNDLLDLMNEYKEKYG